MLNNHFCTMQVTSNLRALAVPVDFIKNHKINDTYVSYDTDLPELEKVIWTINNKTIFGVDEI